MISADILQFGTDEYLFVANSYSIWLELLCFLGGKTANDVIAALKPINFLRGLVDQIYYYLIARLLEVLSFDNVQMNGICKNR